MAIIKSFVTLTLLLGSSLGALAAGNKTATNGIGSLPAQRHVISVDQAESIIAAAVKEASTVIPENIAIVDPSGLLVAFHRMDNAYPGSIDISIKKARTSVLFNGMATADLNAAAQGVLYGVEETNGGLVVFGGGLPLYKDDYLIGGIGVSGGSVDQDVQVVKAAVSWFSNATLSHY
ncbi:hypothetical protein D6C84_02282 [Aureobasidium pullulans]|uniref:DUF336-domain-containing protein n=1 Tax=Aureobasidium pullulans TaxID=5580 RepID=A0A4S8SRS4_AURPU|nr:hypothetical protein JADG_001270 [Aureobasidium pullulans]THV66377.1 hypothetical protein D6D27_10291 [Aureobasidium pullulans]THV73740.1 hypothetical protein D6D28_03067 [Aureobasidium pullulans]THV78726.1 hypothetical protein D6D29_07449 [Aureobasidium pullulans]THW13086.1 hypothetical protein D6D25_07345 [Aureobasidium pullulans]